MANGDIEMKDASSASIVPFRDIYETPLCAATSIENKHLDVIIDENGKATSPILPNVTELNQAILCDDMPALASVQLGPTGRSVSRSYGATLSKLVPRGNCVTVIIFKDLLTVFNRDDCWC